MSGKYFSIAVLALAGVVFAALVGLNFQNRVYYTESLAGIAYHFALPGALSIGCLYLLSRTQTVRLIAALNLSAIAFSLYAAEAYVTWSQDRAVRAAAAASGIVYDPRTKTEVLFDLRRSGRRAYPATRGKAFLVSSEDASALVPAIQVKGESLLPLASVPDATIVSCNETGRWMIFESDRHGFHNADEVWRHRPVDLVLVGDSFVQGDCVDSADNIAAHLGRGWRVINLGVAGFGPLEQLATVKEYAPLVSPRLVLWFYYEGNDLVKDLPVEKRAPLLRNYVYRENFRQNLASRPEQVADALGSYIDEKLSETLEEVDHPRQRLLDFLQLYRLRESLGLDPVGLGIFEPLDESDFRLFGDALGEAARVASEWQGRLVFVYLPDSARYFAAERDSRIRRRLRHRAIEIVRQRGFPIIDVTGAFDDHPDPRRLFHYPGSHYNPDGYRLAAEAVRRGLEDLRLVDPPRAEGGA